MQLEILQKLKFVTVLKIQLLVDLKNAEQTYLLAKIGADTAANERNFAKKLTKICNYPTLPYGSCAGRGGPWSPLGALPRLLGRFEVADRLIPALISGR